MEIKIERWPYCGYTEFGEGIQIGHGAVQVSNRIFKSSGLYHIVCLNCGSVVRSYVDKPAKFKQDNS